MTVPAAPTVSVVSAAQAAARDRAAIAAGIPSRALMQRAGAGAAALLAQRWPRRLAGGVAIYAGGGNNGGDAWVVAAALAATGVPVRVAEVSPAATDDARAERAHARAVLGADAGREPDGTEPVVVDGLLGTGSRGAPRGPVGAAIARIAAHRARGARIVALDVPSGVDATTGAAEGAVTADLTVTFGTLKRGLLVARAQAGVIAVVDIGLGAFATAADGPAPGLVDARWVRERVPAIGVRAHKGTRGRLAIVGGAAGMAGAVVLAARAALRAGAGLVRLLVAPESVAAVQVSVPEAIAAAWPADARAARRELGDWAHGLLLGPGLGGDARALVERVLAATRAPAVLDADALNAFAGDAGALAAALDGRAALLTPHPGELARLAGGTADEVDRERWDVAGPLAARTGAAVLLKGVPTVVTDAGGARWTSAAGTPALAVGGSGDLLAGLAATLVMQRDEALDSGACAAWLHGRAAELASADGVRGATLADVLDALPRAWREPVLPAPYPVLAWLPAVPDA